MATLMVLVGTSYSGKSTYAEKKSKELNIPVISSDEVRKELYGNESIQGNPKEVFKKVYEIAEFYSKHNVSFILDATNLSTKYRRNFISQPFLKNYRKEVYIFATPYDECIARQKLRKRYVDSSIINSQIKQFQVPTKSEGWDSINIIRPTTLIDIQKTFVAFYDMPQENHWHTQTLGAHMDHVAELFCTKRPDDFIGGLAAQYHDIGKPFVKTYFKRDGTLTPEAHYPNHQNVGAYLILCSNIMEEYNLSKDEMLRVASLVSYHMESIFRTAENYNKFLSNFDDEFKEQLMTISECDHNYD